MDIDEEVKPFYDSEYFETMTEEYSHLSYEYVFREISLILEKYVRKEYIALDMGCGVGWLLRRNLDLKCSAVGIDFSVEALKFARRGLRDTDLLVSDAGRTPFKNEAFDFITCIWLLEHVREPEEILDEVFRILKKGGIAIIMSPSGELTRNKKKIPDFSSPEEFGEEHFWEFSPIGLQALIQKSGFKINERRGIYRFHISNLFTFPIFKLISNVLTHNTNTKPDHSIEESNESGLE
ncbi:MAG: class I SAM-dependent methyltransferase, partial [Candidatus Ranarchaeia archaeon]